MVTVPEVPPQPFSRLIVAVEDIGGVWPLVSEVCKQSVR